MRSNTRYSTLHALLVLLNHLSCGCRSILTTRSLLEISKIKQSPSNQGWDRQMCDSCFFFVWIVITVTEKVTLEFFVPRFTY